jgi:hypothetical protein
MTRRFTVETIGNFANGDQGSRPRRLEQLMGNSPVLEEYSGMNTSPAEFQRQPPSRIEKDRNRAQLFSS